MADWPNQWIRLFVERRASLCAPDYEIIIVGGRSPGVLRSNKNLPSRRLVCGFWALPIGTVDFSSASCRLHKRNNIMTKHLPTPAKHTYYPHWIELETGHPRISGEVIKCYSTHGVE